MTNWASTTRWNNLLTLLNHLRQERGFIYHTFIRWIKQSDINFLRNGTIEILEDYGFTGLEEALNLVGYDYDSWKTWEQNWIADRSLNEIEDILNSMTPGREFFSNPSSFALRYSISKVIFDDETPTTYIAASNSTDIGERYISELEEYRITRMVGSAETFTIPDDVNIMKAKIGIYVTNLTGGDFDIYIYTSDWSLRKYPGADSRTLTSEDSETWKDIYPSAEAMWDDIFNNSVGIYIGKVSSVDALSATGNFVWIDIPKELINKDKRTDFIFIAQATEGQRVWGGYIEASFYYAY